MYEPHFSEVGGVGKGSMECHKKVTHTIVCPTTGGQPVAGTFTAPELESDRVPALLGLKSLSHMRAMMDMDPKNPRLIVPGPGGVKLVLSPGMVIYPLEPTHSGHLLMPCSELTRRPGEETITLVTGVEASSLGVGVVPLTSQAAATQTAGQAASSAEVRRAPPL